MPNKFKLAQNFTSNLDLVYESEVTTNEFLSDASLARKGNNANEICIPMIKVSGLGNYSRNEGYTKGSVTVEWETLKFNYDRGTLFEVDAMDDEETFNIAFGKAGAEFMRTQVAPESDAFFYAKMAGTPDISKQEGTITNGEELIKALVAATSKMDEDRVSQGSRELRVNSTLYNMILELDLTKRLDVFGRFSNVRAVPQYKFYTGIKMKDGKSAGEEDGGFEKAAGARDINFMVVEKSAVYYYKKHVTGNVISPDDNQHADAYMMKYRNYGLVDVYENKRAGVYVHHKGA